MKKWYIIILMVMVMIVCSLGYLNSQGDIDVVNTMNGFIRTFTGGGITPEVPVEKEITGNYIGESGTQIIWNINKTGAEENLDVNYNVLNDTATEFCIEVIDRKKYESDLNLGAKDISNIPIEKTKLAKEFTIEKTDLNLSKEEKRIEEKENCFIVTYLELKLGMQFKIGWDSIVIDASASSTATAYSQTNSFCIGINDICHVAYSGSSADLFYANTTYDGISCGDTWSVTELIDSITASSAGITCNPNGSIFIYYEDITNYNIYYYFNDNSGKSPWVSGTLASDADSFGLPSCAVDGNNILQCCMIESGSADDLWYVNSSDIENERELDDTDQNICDIEVDADNNVYILTSGDLTDDLEVLSSKDGYGSVNVWYTGAGMTNDPVYNPSIAIQENGTMYIVGIDVTDLQFCEGDVNSWTSSASCVELDSSTSVRPHIAISKNGDPYILYTDSTGLSNVVLANRTNGGSWQVRNVIISSSSYPSIADSTYPTSNRMDNILHYVVSQSNIAYSNFTIQPAPTYTLTITNPTTADPYTNVVSGQTLEIDFNVTKTYQGTTTAIISGVTMENVTVDETVCVINTTIGTTIAEITLDDTSTEVLADISSEDDAPGSENTQAQIMFDVSALAGTTILNATLCLYLDDHLSGAIDNDVTYWRIDDQTWDETITTAEYDAQSKDTATTGKTFDRVDEGYYSCLNVTLVVEADVGDGNSYTTIRLEDPDNVHDGSSTAIQDEGTWGIMFGGKAVDGVASFEDRENTKSSGNTPYMIVWYEGTTTSQQFVYSSSKGVWEVNCSAPTKGDGTYDLFLNATYLDITYNNTQADTITYGSEADTIPPTINCSFNKSIDSIYQNDVLNFSCNATDETELSTLNMTWNYTTGIVYSNYTVTTPAYIDNVTTITDAPGNVINFTGYATDTSGNVKQNSTLVTIATSDTCSCPSSGDWIINCADNCVITSDCDMQTNDIHSYGIGTIEVNALIYNFGNLFNRCDLFCRNIPTCFG